MGFSMSELRHKCSITFFSIFVALAAFSFQSLTPARATEAGATAQNLLFDSPYLSSMPSPSSLSYGLIHATGHDAVYGEPFNDDVLLRLEPSPEEGKPDPVYMDVYTGKRQRKLGPFSKLYGNRLL